MIVNVRCAIDVGGLASIGLVAVTQADAVRMDIVLGQEPILGTVERK